MTGGAVVFDPIQIVRPAFIYYSRLRKIDEYIQGHLSQPVSLEKAAHIAGMEKNYFSTFFHRKTGVRFRDWLNHVRIERGKELMKAENHPITLVGEMVGFADLRTFERVFKKLSGMTPREFKKFVRPS